jgi:hypothetical protein
MALDGSSLLLVMRPDHIDHEMFEQAVEAARERHPNPSLEKPRLERWREGRSIGPRRAKPKNLKTILRHPILPD